MIHNNCKQILMTALLLQLTTVSQAMNHVHKRSTREKCLSEHILNYNNRSAKISLNQHDQDSLNNSLNFENGRLPLNTAISTENIEIIENLLDAGANPNNEDGFGSPLREAAKLGNIFIMNLLVQRGAKFDEETLNFALHFVEQKRFRLLWPGVDFSSLQSNTSEDKIKFIQNKIKELADQSK